MKEKFNDLRIKFNEIKNMDLVESLRNGTTGVGYTFETLLGKKEDFESIPDYNGIEIKTKLGYSKSPITLFTCTPKRNNESALNYILEKYSWPSNNHFDTLIFSNEVFFGQIGKKFNYNFKLDIDYFQKKIFLQAYKNDLFVENVCYWEFYELLKKLNFKLKYLAIVYAYPYKKNKKVYYKYVKMNTYKLKSFFDFLDLIRNDKIKITFYLKKFVNGSIENHGVSFKIENENISDLFYKLHY